MGRNRYHNQIFAEKLAESTVFNDRLTHDPVILSVLELTLEVLTLATTISNTKIIHAIKNQKSVKSNSGFRKFSHKLP